MMKWLRTLTLAVDWWIATWAAFTVVAAYVITGGRYIGFEFVYGQFIWSLADNMLLFAAICALLVLLNLIVAISFVTEALRARYIQLAGTGGRIQVSVRAVQDSLMRAVMALPEVIAAQVKVAPAKGPGKPAVVHAHVTLKDDVIYHAVSRNIINVIENRFGDIVSPGTPVECHVSWERIKYKRGTVAVIRREPAESMRPQFPVEEDEI